MRSLRFRGRRSRRLWATPQARACLCPSSRRRRGRRRPSCSRRKRARSSQGLAAADKTVDDLQCLAFDAGVADSKESDMGRLLRVSVHGIDGSWIDLTPESFGTGGATAFAQGSHSKRQAGRNQLGRVLFQIGAHVHFVRRRDGPGLLFRQRGACQRRRAVRLHGWNVHGGSGGDGLVRPARGAVP